GSHPPPAPARTGRGNPLPAAAQSITGTGRSRRPPRHGRMDPAPPPQGRSRHAISGHHRRHAPGPGAELHEGYGNRTGRNRLPARLLLTGSIPARIQALDRRSTRAISPADETAKAGLKRVPSRAPIRTRHGCSYGGYGVVTFGVGAPPTVRTGQAHTRTRGGCSYNKYANSHPWRLLLPREGVERLPLTSPAHHLQRHPIPGRVAPAVLLHTRSYCSLLLDHSLHGNRFNLTPLLYSQMKATRESSEAIDFATVSGL